jgi:PadR family transcriptional regulator AphA
MLLRYTILGLLEGQELHGYRIKAVFEQRIGPLWPLNFGQIYQTLKDLRRRELIAARFERGTGHVGRWVYSTTPKGRRSLDTWMHRSPLLPQPSRDEMLIRLLVSERSDVTTRLAQIANEERVYREYVAGLTAQRRMFGVVPEEGNLLKALAADASIFHAEAHLRWLAHCVKLLKRVASTPAGTQAAGTRKASKRSAAATDVGARMDEGTPMTG